MHSARRTFIAVCILLVASARVAAAALAGTWEGSENGHRSVSLELRDSPVLEGSATFYIVRDNGAGEHDGGALPALPMLHLEWDGRVLHFDVKTGDRLISFEMKLTGDGKATLKRVVSKDLPELTIPLTALR